MTAPDLVSVIEAALIPHDAKVVYYSADEGHVECHGCDWKGPSFTGFAAHQARAVLAAISEAGTVEWGVHVGGQEKPYTYDSEVSASGDAKCNCCTLVSRIAGPWTAVEG